MSLPGFVAAVINRHTLVMALNRVFLQGAEWEFEERFT